MMKLKGELVLLDGELCMKVQFTPDNPSLYEIPLGDLLEDFVGKRVNIDILEVKNLDEIDMHIPEAYKK